MRMSKEGKIFLAGVEGVAKSCYLDSVGIKTIGIGATVSEIPDIAKMPWDKEISVKEAFELLDKSLVKYENAVNNGLKVQVPQYTFDALVSWIYNVGTGWVKKSTLIKVINSGEHNKDYLRKLLLMYNKPKEIIGRRTKEADLMVGGKYGDGKVNLFPVSPATHKPIYSRSVSINAEDYL